MPVAADGLDRVVPDRADHLGAIEDPALLLGCQPVQDIPVLEDLLERPAALVLADHVCGDTLLGRGALEQERERIPPPVGHRSDCILPTVKLHSKQGRFAERELRGVDDAGAEERIVIWVERKQGGVWAVGRAVNVQYRPSDDPRPDDYVFEGFELEDAVEAANDALADDLRVSERDGRAEQVEPFTREELLRPLERWFFGRR